MNIELTRLHTVSKVCHELGIFIDANVSTYEDGTISVCANEYGDIDTEPFGFSFLLYGKHTGSELVHISGEGVDIHVFPEDRERIKEVLEQALITGGFIRTWVRAKV